MVTSMVPLLSPTLAESPKVQPVIVVLLFMVPLIAAPVTLARFIRSALNVPPVMIASVILRTEQLNVPPVMVPLFSRYAIPANVPPLISP